MLWRLPLASVAVLGLTGVLLAAAPLPADRDPEPSEHITAGEELYAWNCAVCHGATGGGLAEAKLAFPSDHRDCTRCHRPNNRVAQPLDQPFTDNDMFSIGDPPALHGGGSSLAAVAPPAALHAYLSATMPRYDPGRLSEEEYWALTAFLLELNGRDEEAAEVASPR